MPLDHTNLQIPLPKLEALLTFLTKSLAHVGIKEMMRPAPNVVGMGDSVPFFWVTGVDVDVEVGGRGGVFVSAEVERGWFEGVHVAFRGESIQDVRKFYAAAMEAGGVDNGKPGRRPQYYAGYYGAFVRDPVCGINFEMVFHGCPEDEEMLRKMEEDGDS